MSEQAPPVKLWRCPRCGTPLREVETKSMFTRHAGCSMCEILYVLWGATMTRCLTPIACAGHAWKYLQDAPPRKAYPARAPQAKEK